MATAVERFDRERRVFGFGRTEVHEGELFRHTVYTRFMHWMVAVFFFLSLFSGFGIYLPWVFRWFTPVFGGGPLTRTLHPWFGLGFVVFVSLEFLNWLQPMKWTPADDRWLRRMRQFLTNEEKLEPEDVGFFNAGQKMQFWEIAAGSVVYLITGVVLWAGASTFGRIAVAVSYVLHDISALIMLFGIFIHIYQGTFGQPGTFQAIARGTVSEAWAWTHHPAWFREATGRDPRQAYENARRAQQARMREAQGPPEKKM